MLRVIIDLCPFGDESKARKIGEMVIGNTGSAGGNLANYVVLLEGIEVAQVEAFDRGEGPWELVAEAVGKLTDNQKQGRKLT